MGLLFHPNTPGLSAATISKMPLKPPLPSSTESTVSIPNSKLIEYRTVALELVREHPWLTETHAVPHALLLGRWVVSWPVPRLSIVPWPLRPLGR
jgi:hypothetical protein